jgi:hypothetical protein
MDPPFGADPARNQAAFLHYPGRADSINPTALICLQISNHKIRDRCEINKQTSRKFFLRQSAQFHLNFEDPGKWWAEAT